MELAVWAGLTGWSGATGPKPDGTNQPENRARAEDPKAEGLLDPSA